jgi:hypothetical protein
MTSRKKPQPKKSKVPFYVGGAILALLLVAFITTGLTGDGDTDNGSSNTQEYADVSVSGDSLPLLPGEGGDPAVGMTMPEVTGESFAGTPVTFTNDGRAKVIFFLAHW